MLKGTSMNDRSSTENLYAHQGKRRLVLMFAIALALTALPASIFAQIQLDGNAKKVDGTGATGTDWDEVNCPNSSITSCVGLTAGGGSIAKTGLTIDRPEPTFAQFTGGGSKDEQDITSWRHRSGTPPAKDDLSHAFAAAFTRASDGHTILAFGMDRYDTSGDAQLGFWFLAQNAQPAANGTFTNGVNGPPAEHQNGDLLVLVNFSGGGDTPTIQVFEWNNGGVTSLGIGGTVLCSGGTIPAAGFCGITNGANVAAPWTYENKNLGPTTSFPPASFFEGGIDLTGLGLTGCFTGFIAESRSSTSITATLKDFADPGNGFNLCSIGVTKECTTPVLNAAQTHITYTIQGMVTNSGAGTLYNITLSDDPNADPAGASEHFDKVDCATKLVDEGDFPVTSLIGGASVCYKATMTVPIAENGRSDTVTVTADTESDGSGTELTQNATIQCPNLQVNPSLSVTKTCSTSVEVNPTTNQVVVKVTISGDVCNTGDSTLTDVKVEDIGITGINPLVSGVTLPSTNPDTCQSFTATYFPSATNSSTPASVVFSDTVKATAKDIFGNAVPNKNTTPPQPDVTFTATCRLCPTCPTCP
jgi:hypothetical protein